MVDPDVAQALKWIGIVFVAGFIGYFGRRLAKRIISSFSKKDKIEDSDEKAYSSVHDYDAERNRIKLEKKRIKQQKKLNKKK